MNHKFDESHICVACGHSQGWAEKWQVFECITEVAAWCNIEALMLGVDEDLALSPKIFADKYIQPALNQHIEEMKNILDMQSPQIALDGRKNLD